MSDSATEGVNPAWKPLLDALPESLHGIVTPHLKQWDKTTQDKLQEVRDSYKDYEAYKPLVDSKVPLENIGAALQFVNELSQDPAGVISRINESMELGFLSADEAAALQNNSNGSGTDGFETEGGNVDLSQHPAFKELSGQLNKLQETLTKQSQQSQEDKEIEEFEKMVAETLGKEENKSVPRELFLGLMSGGMDEAAALEKAKELVAGNIQLPDTTVTPPPAPPTVLGGEGTAGSGVPDGAIDFSKMSSGDVQDLVTRHLEQTAASNNQG